MAEHEQSFQLRYDDGTVQYQVEVSPAWDDEEGESRFVIALDAVEIGILRKTEDDAWEWIKGGAGDAREIGILIDRYYLQ